jgi:hypothetical protein
MPDPRLDSDLFLWLKCFQGIFLRLGFENFPPHTLYRYDIIAVSVLL